MVGRRVTVELPDDLYERLERRAAEARRSLGNEVVRPLAEAAPDEDDGLPPELEQELDWMVMLDDAALRRAARSRLTVHESRRLESLLFKSPQAARDGS